MLKRHIVAVIFLLVGLTWLLAGSLVQQPQGFASLSRGDRLAAWREDEDFYIYFSGLGWIQRDQPLYERGSAEYPTLGLMYINWPKLINNNFPAYQALLRLSNLLCYVLAGWLTWRIGERLFGAVSRTWWVWLLPGALYFSFNVFDIFPVTLVLASLHLVLQRHYRSGWFIFGLAVMAKVFPIVLLPLYWQLTREHESRVWPQAVYALAAVIGLTLGTVASGGWLAAVWLYGAHLSRAAEPGSALFTILALWPSLASYRLAFHSFFHILQLALPLWWSVRAFARQGLTATTHFTLAALALLGLTFFNPFYSGQWWLWALPFVIFALPRGRWWLLIGYDVLVYLQLPIAFQVFGPLSATFNAVVLMRSAVLALIMLVLWQQLPKKWWVLL